MGNNDFDMGDEIWDGAVAIIAFEDDGTKHLVCQSGIRMSADQQLKLAEDLKQNALKNYDNIEAIRKKQRQKLIDEWRGWMESPEEIKTKAVYMMKAGNDYKVGVSNDPQRRLHDILRHRPDAELIAYSKQMPVKDALNVEKKLHKTLEKRNLVGEWFVLHPEEANTIASWIQEAE